MSFISIGKEDVYSKLSLSEKEIVHTASKQYDLVQQFEGIKELVLTKHFKENISQFASKKQQLEA